MLAQVWKTIRTAFLVIGVLLCFFAIVEIVQAYQVLRNVHPALGYLFAVALLAGIAWLVVRYIVAVVRLPPVLVAPVRIDGEARDSDWWGYGRYLVRVMRRLSANQELSSDQQQALVEGMESLRRALAEATEAGGLKQVVTATESGIVQPAVDSLDELAEGEVRRCVRDVMLGVTLSPWRSVDLVVVVYRNMGMVLRIVSIYNARPRVREQALVLRDVLAVVATVNFLNYGSRLSQNLLSSVPGLGRFTDDVAQGVGAGLLTSVAGHCAVDRCRAFRGWNREEAQRTIVRTLQAFMVDIKGIMVDQILPYLGPELVDKIRQGVSAAIDETAKATEWIIRKPVVAAGRTVAGTGSVVGTVLLRGGATAWRGLASVCRRAAGVVSSLRKNPS